MHLPELHSFAIEIVDAINRLLPIILEILLYNDNHVINSLTAFTERDKFTHCPIQPLKIYCLQTYKIYSYLRMNSLELIPCKKRADIEQTAFTSLLVGVFLNSPLVTSQHLRGIREDDIFQIYGESFRHSLLQYSSQTTPRQIQTMHQLQKYVIRSFRSFFSNHLDCVNIISFKGLFITLSAKPGPPTLLILCKF